MADAALEPVGLAAIAAGFGQRLHQAGVPVTPDRSARFAHAAALVAPRRLAELYWIGRVTLVSAQAQIETYDAVFREVFRGLIDLPPSPVTAPEPSPSAQESGEQQPSAADTAGDRGVPPTVSAAGDLAEADQPDLDASEAALAAASPTEHLGEQDFATCTAAELAMLARLAERLQVVPPQRRSRRSRAHPRGRRPDVRATLRRSRRTGGDPVVLVRRRRGRRHRRVVLLADVSGSMAPYSRIYLHLMRGAVRGVHAESFVFATRLTRLTRLLSDGRPDAAYRAVARAATDWSGGTRLGEALTAFLDQHGRRGLARGAVVVIVSDGWEIGDPEQVGEAMRRLRRLAHHVIWVNPRSARPGFEPLVAGLRAALPYVDTVVSGHSLRALDDVLDAIAVAEAAPRHAGPPR